MAKNERFLRRQRREVVRQWRKLQKKKSQKKKLIKTAVLFTSVLFLGTAAACRTDWRGLLKETLSSLVQIYPFEEKVLADPGASREDGIGFWAEKGVFFLFHIEQGNAVDSN